MIQDQIIATIEAYDKIIIHRHVKPDPDALGSQGGLAAALRAAYPSKQVYQVGGSVGDLDWLSQMQTIPDDLYQGALVIVVDTADRPRVSDQRFDQGAKLIKIDHHPNDDAYGDLQWVDEDASSVSEMIFDLIQQTPSWNLNAKSARLLYAGIVGDTGRFLYNNTTPHTLEAAARLIREDFDPTALNNKMGALTFAQAKLQSYIFNHLTITPAGAATVTIPLAVTLELGLTPDQVHAGVGTPGRLGEVIAWALFVEQADGEPYRVNLRSKGPIINGLAKAHHGGGHPLASGAKAMDQAEITQITKELSQLVADFGK
ncbi:MAG: bifunctional oligoribonuclease/PAP phosphatase NrnA [Lactobacillus sp.]|jgi:phosphoesterase RecJ-like protein|nr:bifunctional oligoribonuclease/PAP phosphatase NrnA [Lactobacillus sp.]MCI1916718.1 bifunctional oligoribonuclease/PAP phosphatase NrnA [Lactobacillus sp.]MCI1941367.1 bifunctional oligoribonuclease/PAP phosphatase NrnA [Lactobacillus sp.]MCI1971912.1 bifunctional oligoribonuclease/PAP phosphatase NrnA [Lactobacillus sp.]MCI2016581.1 bifunctional oligoribonuclease/PAP phosphatase NrnA [Lactobacillus sp.]